MKLSYKWLQEFVDIQVPAEELEKVLTNIGLEVEDIEFQAKNWAGMVVGKVVQCEPHPNADQLQVCQVEFGQEETATVVCGAPNCRLGLISAFAPLGVSIGDFTITKKKLRGVTSCGMLCSEKELGLSDSHAGIMELPENTVVGSPLSSVLQMDDIIFDLEITPNRPDCLGIMGLAREVAAHYGKTVRVPEIKLEESSWNTADQIQILVQNNEACPRYSGRVMKNITIKPSPEWMQKRLVACGLRPINNVVDATNYVMLEMGHPLHAFDLKNIKGQKIIVRNARDKEAFVTLDGRKHQLNPDVLVIADEQDAVALAGVMGGEYSGVQADTTDLLLECAYFNSSSIRKTARTYNIFTDSSHRFERQMDPNATLRVIDRLAQIIQQIAGGEIGKGIVDVYPQPITAQVIDFRPQRANQMLGVDIPAQTQEQLLRSIDLQMDTTDSENWHVEAPTFRPDLSREIDLIEEIARLYGYDRIPERFPAATEFPRYKPDETRFIQDIFVAAGLNEVINNGFTSAKKLKTIDVLNDDANHRALQVLNPMGEDFAFLRTSLLTGLLENVRHNLNFGMKSIQLFEYDLVFLKTEDVLPEERKNLAIALCGLASQKHWKDHVQDVDFYTLKGYVEFLFEKLRLQAEVRFASIESSWFATGAAAQIELNGTKVGELGLLKTSLVDTFDIEKKVYFAEINMDLVLKISRETLWYQPLKRFPAVYRDFAFVLDTHVSADEIEQAIRKTGGSDLTAVQLFDVYAGKGIATGKRSLAFNLAFQSNEKTLTDKYVDKCCKKVLYFLEKEYGATLR